MKMFGILVLMLCFFAFQVIEPVCKIEPLDVPLKKPKMEDFYNYMYAMEPYIQFQAKAFYDQCRAFSALGPWSNMRPFLSHEPPLLQHPEKVVRSKDTSKFETSFQPNVALKPQHPPTPPSSDEITSSTSPHPGSDAATNLPPPDCELSTDTDEEDVKDLLINQESELTSMKEAQSHTRKSISIKEHKVIQLENVHKEDEYENIKEKDRILEELREKDNLIARQAELLEEKDAIIASLSKELELLKQKQTTATGLDEDLANGEEEVVEKEEDIIIEQDLSVTQIDIETEDGKVSDDSEPSGDDTSIVDIESSKNSDQNNICEILLESQQGCENENTDSIKWERQ